MRPVLLALVFSGCADPDCEQELAPAPALSGSDTPFDAYDPSACVPDEDMWDTTVAELVDTQCGSCHGVEPSFGAPASLTAYADLIAGDPGNRPVDRMARRAVMRTMPPPQSPQLEHADLDTLVAWATCGEVHPDPTVGLEVDRAPYSVDAPDNADLPSFDVLADSFEVTPQTLDQYQCFAMDVPLEETRFLRRMQVVLDDARVLHHVVLHHDPAASTQGQDVFDCDDGLTGTTQQLWAWAPGTGAFDFEDGGLELSPGERLVIEIHYNNGAGLQDVVDSSGIRLFHGPAEGPEWTLAALGPEQFGVRKGESAVCSSSEVFGPRRLLASLPHMHEVGAEFDSWLERADGTREDLIHLTGWNFEAQRFYGLDVLVDEGDVIHTRCGFRNETGHRVTSGLATEDEMCFDFMYVGPQ
ncbi:MAG: hypothetical protein KC912_22815 [Proteobacteria bacterium]|nr:hypothetical protein [Pseudomonadota bacterium]